MFKISILSLILSLICSTSFSADIYDLSYKDLGGDSQSMKQYKGKSILIVNTASACGYTPQLKGLQALYEKYKSKGFVVIGFPSNDFNQESLKGKKIANFCLINYGVKFPIAKKSSIRGKGKNAVFSYLSSKLNNHNVKWNFEKFLISKKGDVLGNFSSSEKPLGGALEKAVAASLETGK